MKAALSKDLSVVCIDARIVAGVLVYTKLSIDDWIERGDRAGEPRTPEELSRLLDDDDD
jgi:hypothetical protein